MRGGDEDARLTGGLLSSSRSYGSVTATHGPGAPDGAESDEDDDLVGLIRNDEGRSLTWRLGAFVSRPRWWFAVVVTMTLYALYTNQATDVAGVPEPGYLIEPTVYETRWWERWWSPWGEVGPVDADLAAEEVNAGGNRTRARGGGGKRRRESDGGGGGGESSTGGGGKGGLGRSETTPEPTSRELAFSSQN